MISKIKQIQLSLGGRLIPDPYPDFMPDTEQWVTLLYLANTKGIGLYGELMKIRAIGAKLEKSDKFGYVIKPMFIGKDKRGFPSEERWNEEKKNLMPYKEILKELLKEID